MAEMTRAGSEVFRILDMIPSQHDTNSGQAIEAMMARIDTAITKRKPDPMSFKIGITWNPPYRWVNPTYGYQHDCFIQMEILAWGFRAAIIGLYEAAFINNYQKGTLWLSKKLGDDNRQDMSPQFMYVCYKP